MSAFLFRIPRIRYFSIAGSTIVIALLVSLVVMLQKGGGLMPEQLTVREVELAALPPPPPPPPSPQRVDQLPQISVSQGGSGAAVNLGEMHLGEVLVVEDIDPPPLPINNANMLHDSLQLSWDEVFSLADLDERPRLLTKLNIQYPKRLSKQGIHRAEARVAVIIDTDGRAILKEILHCSHEEMRSLVVDLIKRARFTAPKKDGQLVRASFTWPLEFNDS